MKKIIVLIYLLLPATLVWGQTSLGARGLGMAGAYQGLATGAEAPLWNPANLGLPGNPNLSFDILGFGFNLGNNSLNLSLYNQYFSQDYFEANNQWDEQAKSAILSYIFKLVCICLPVIHHGLALVEQVLDCCRIATGLVQI